MRGVAAPRDARHFGIRPHTKVSIRRWRSTIDMPAIRLVGATFQLGRRFTSPTSASKIDARFDTGVDATKRPHINCKCKTEGVRIDLHINQSLAPFPELLDCARRADQGHFDGIWVLDHLASMRPTDQALGDMLDPHLLLGAFASTTSRVRLGVLVNNVAVRPAHVIAGATASLDIVSDGRAVLGLGAGAAPDTYFASEFDALNITLDPRTNVRQERVMETLSTIRSIWTGEADKGVRFPRPSSNIPVVVGVNSERLARMAAAAGCGINVRADHPHVERIIGCANRGLTDEAASVWLPYSRDLTNTRHPSFRELEAMGVGRVMLLTMTRDDIVNV